MKINSNKLKSLILLSLVGSASTNEQKPTNQSELTLNSLPQMGANFTKRENETDPTFVFGGYPLFIGGGGPSCSAGFAIVWPDENAGSGCSWGALSGFITSAGCCDSDNYGNNYCKNFRDVFLNSEDKTKIGYVRRTSLDYYQEHLVDINVFKFIDLAFVIHESLIGVEDNIKLIPYVVGENNDLIPITSYGPASVGERVCVYSGTSGRMCGKVVIYNDNSIHFFTLVGKVIMEVVLPNYADYGGPVYKETNIGERTIAQLVGHVSYHELDNNNVYYIYYTRIEKTLEFLATKENCNMVPLVYNETNSQQYDHLLAQMEIPAKK